MHNYRNDERRIVSGTAVLVTLIAITFSIFCSILLLKLILYDYGSLYSNILLLASIFCARYYLIMANKALRTHEKVCLALFILYDRDVLDFFNVFLLVGVGCIRQQMNDSPLIKELVSVTIGLIFLLMGWLSVGRVLVIYNFTIILIVVFTAVIVLLNFVFRYFFCSSSNAWDEIN